MSEQTRDRDDLDQPFVHPRPLRGAAAFAFNAALADIEERRRIAIQQAHKTLDEMDRFDAHKDWNAESLRAEYDTDSEADETN